jgi:ubiquitin C-terminal hydrolase
MYLSLPIPRREKKPTLHQCLAEFTKTEKLKSDECWECEKCKHQVRATKKLEIWKLPPILIIHLKRFRFTDRKREKVKKLVEFPITGLEITSFEKGR